jgi:tetratricopeptide (TPR) repeat protein
MFLWAILIIAGLAIYYALRGGEIASPFVPTPTPTRTTFSLNSEGDALFTAGKLNDAIIAYGESLQVNPNDAEGWANLARMQVYSSALLTTDADRKQRMQEALLSIDRAVEVDAENSNVRAIRAFVLDWSANPALAGDQAEALLIAAEKEAAIALQLDPQNTLALAYFAEILVDQQKWSQAQINIEQAIERGEDIMDVHRVYAYVLESQSYYRQAIEEYDKAIAIMPNLTFLYISAGTNYRQLALTAPTTEQAEPLYALALDYYDKAAKINSQLGVRDPIPYIAIGKVYVQQGEFFAASRNVQKALSFDQANPTMYGQLGIVFQQSRNYEGAIDALRCAVRGCSEEQSCVARGGCGEGEFGVQVIGLPLSDTTVVYYYTYGSVLAALSRPKNNQCPEALAVFAEVRAKFDETAPFMGIVRAGEDICNSLGQP